LPRYVVIESRTGAIFGRPVEAQSPVDAVCSAHRERGAAPRSFGRVSRGSPNADFDVFAVEPAIEALDADAVRAGGRHDATLIAYNV
jgi:hypothetical protein